MKIAYPVRYDNANNIIVDANQKTIAILTWPKCARSIEDTNEIGREIVTAMNYPRTVVLPQVESVKRPRGNPNWTKRKEPQNVA